MRKGIIITSFGTTFDETRKLNIEPIENLANERYGDHLVLRAFTSRIVIKRLKDRGYHVDNPTQALEKMKKENIKDIFIQPLLIIEGHEYEKIKKEASDFLNKNPDFKIQIGVPLLSEDIDFEKIVNALELKGYEEDRALVFMGHGSDHIADRAYSKLENEFHGLGYKNIFIGTVEGAIDIFETIKKLKENKISKVELRPFMLVAGDHAVNDMASDEDKSWKTILTEEGFKVDLNISGLGQEDKIREIFMDHLADITNN